MSSEPSIQAGVCPEAACHPFSPGEIEAILRERGWLGAPNAEPDAALQEWLARAAELLGPHAASHEALSALLEPIFVYEAAAALRQTNAATPI